jgi:hypothetical protein
VASGAEGDGVKGGHGAPAQRRNAGGGGGTGRHRLCGGIREGMECLGVPGSPFWHPGGRRVDGWARISGDTVSGSWQELGVDDVDCGGTASCERHARAGRVTCAKPRIYQYTSGPIANNVLPLVPGVGHDVGTVLSAKGGKRHYCKPPSDRAVVPLGVQNLGSSDSPIYHGGELLPGRIDKGTRVFTPSMYAPAGKWAVWPLFYNEVLLCKDVSETMVRRLTECDPALDAILCGTMVPGECLV